MLCALHPPPPLLQAVAQPMDLRTVAKKLGAGGYESPLDVLMDVGLVSWHV
jgi:hypothetical protein